MFVLWNKWGQGYPSPWNLWLRPCSIFYTYSLKYWRWTPPTSWQEQCYSCLWFSLQYQISSLLGAESNCVTPANLLGSGSWYISQTSLGALSQLLSRYYRKSRILLWLPPLYPMACKQVTLMGLFVRQPTDDQLWNVLEIYQYQLVPRGRSTRIPSAWPGVAINQSMAVGNSMSKKHIDWQDCVSGFNAVIPWGNFGGGNLILWPAKNV